MAYHLEMADTYLICKIAVFFCYIMKHYVWYKNLIKILNYILYNGLNISNLP